MCVEKVLRKRLQMKWSEEAPIAPSKGFNNEYYWFYDTKEMKMWVVEVWPGRWLKHFHGYWWTTAIQKPPEKLPLEEIIDGERDEDSERRSARQVGTNNSRKVRRVTNKNSTSDIDAVDSSVQSTEIIKKHRDRPRKEQ